MFPPEGNATRAQFDEARKKGEGCATQAAIPESSGNPVAVCDACTLISAAYELSPRETEVLDLMLKGYKAISIARRLTIAEQTARSHIRNIHRKLGINSHDGLVQLAEAQEACQG